MAPSAKEVLPARVGKAVTQSTASSFKVNMTTQRQGLGLLTLTNTGGDTVTFGGWPTRRS
ncbi:MAG TPA: hypothetical protein VJT49_22085 [Amycolatopsis sp.]|uniref:hypothetical protein n=1 Tax=Amycolatopsis sp. TaxID=37632 RepID=UPI002B45DD1A|nr:hypothetical protein [Amycolatopsis sp.]HKS47750.1 hypothetical protein [Amycolatopsis sp.]